jgi:hypothetical protein
VEYPFGLVSEEGVLGVLLLLIHTSVGCFYQQFYIQEQLFLLVGNKLFTSDDSSVVSELLKSLELLPMLLLLGVHTELPCAIIAYQLVWHMCYLPIISLTNK